MGAAFDTCAGIGRKARIRANTIEKKRAFELDGKLWDRSWDEQFVGRDPDVADAYYDPVRSILADTTTSDVREDLGDPPDVCD